MKKLLILLMLLACRPALASICHGAQVNAGFGADFHNATTLTSFTYDTDYDTLYVALPNMTWIAYQNVPYSMAYQFAASLAPDAFYAQQVKPVYQAAVETNNCLQIATGTGAIWVLN